MFGVKKEKEYTFPAAEEKEPVEVTAAPQPPKPKRPCTLIGPGIKFAGNIEASEDIEINGRVEGNISSVNKVTVTEAGSVKGDVDASEYILLGKCEGNARIAGFTKIGRQGSFRGELHTSTLVTEDGSEFEGTLHLKRVSAPVQALEPEQEDVPVTEEELFK